MVKRKIKEYCGAIENPPRNAKVKERE